MEIAKTLENAEKAFFLVRPQDDKGMSASKEKGEDGGSEDEGEHLKQLRKMVKTESKDYDIIRRRRIWQRQSQRDKEQHSPIFLKRSNRSLTNLQLTKDNSKGLPLPPGRISKHRTRVYASNPAINNYKNITQAMGGNAKRSLYKSLPDRINLISGNLHPAERLLQKKLPKIQPQNVMFSDEILGQELVEEEYEIEPPQEEAEAGDDNHGYEDTEESNTIETSSVSTTAVQADWLFEESLKEEMRKFERQKKRLMINTDDGTIEGIDKRMLEIKEMVRPRKDPRKVIDRIPEEVKLRILKVKSVPLNEFKRQTRKRWKLKDLFKWSVEMVRLLLRCFWNRKKYYIDKTNLGQLRRKIEKEMKGHNQSLTPTSRSSIPAEIETALRTTPWNRDKGHIATVLWLLRTTKAFKALFPAEMEEQLAKNVSYEKYDDGRILAFQSRTPDRFYYVLAGRAVVLRQFKLSMGQVTKEMGYLTKGVTTDPEEMERQWMREDSLVAKGQVEVLILEREAFVYLQTTHQGPPVDFIKSVDLFESFSPETFISHPDAIEYKYYGQGKVVVKDSNRTAWLHLIKSGTVKVVRKQTVVDSVSSNERKFSSRNMDELGCGKYPSHAQAMLGVQAKQKKLQELRCSIPQDLDTLGTLDYTNPLAATIGVELNPANGNADDKQVESNPVKLPVIYRASAKTHLKHFGGKTPPSREGRLSRKATQVQIDVESDDEDDDFDGSPRKERKRKTSGTRLPIINIPTRNSLSTPEESFRPHNMWLTREMTEPVFPPKEKEPVFRKAYLILDLLKTGDVFGLDHLQPALASEPFGYMLLSDGAEIVKISKRFFLQYASNNSMMKVETMYKHYLTEDEAKERLYEKETWAQYKSALWDRITEPIPVPNTVR